VSPGHPRGTPSDATYVKFANVICDAGKPYALKGACTVWRGTDEKVPERATRQPSTLRLLPLGLDTNHGYGKTPVPNSEASKKRAALEKRLSDIKQWAPAARERSSKASLRYTRLWKETKAKGEERYRVLDEQLQKLQAQGVSPFQWKAERDRLQAEAEREMQELWASVSRVLETSNKAFAKWERYCREQGDLLRALEDLAAQERMMYELDNRKDQMMTICKLALANLAMWTRDPVFSCFLRTCNLGALSPFLPTPWNDHFFSAGGICPPASVSRPTIQPRSLAAVSTGQ
jgi:hypothetical protein